MAGRDACHHPEGRRATVYLVAALTWALVWVTLMLVWSRRSYPAMPAVLTLELTFPAAAVVGSEEPIVCTGMFQEGNLLLARYRDESTVVFSYNHWGGPSLMSEPVSIQPGSRHMLRIEMPSLTTYRKPPEGARAWLRVDCDGKPVLHAEVLYHGRLPKQIFFGENPIGASVAPLFRGTIRTPDHRVISGGPESYFTRSERLWVWLRAHPWQAVGAFFVGALAGVLAGWLTAKRVVSWMARAGGRFVNSVLREARTAMEEAPGIPAAETARAASIGWFLAAAGCATVCYTWVVTGGSFRFNHAEVFGSFYDYQAASFLEGRLDVPEEAIGGEAFEARGKLYGYFGPTPALLRLPFVAAGIGFGKLSRALMVVYFLGCLVASYLLLKEALRFARQSGRAEATGSEPSPFASWILVGSVGLGSTILFLGSRGLIFHEAILAGIAFALWSCWCSLRYLSAAGRWWIGALVFGVLAVHARPPAGLFALTLLGCAALIRAAIGWRRDRTLATLRRPILIGGWCVLGFASLNGLAWLKFRTFDPAPLRISRPYATPGRLEHIDGKSFHLVNIPYNVDTYLLYPNFRFIATFPWFYMISDQPRRNFPKAKIDLPDHTLAMPYSMPSLFGLATLGCLGAAVTRPGLRGAITITWLAALPVSLALLAAVATAQRYTGDFVPFLITAGGFGLAAVEGAAPRVRVLLRGVVLVLTLAAVAVNAALTLHYQGEILWGVPEEIRQNYQRMRFTVDRWFAT